MATPGDAAVRAVKAGIDVILDSPDSKAAATAIVAAVNAGDISRARVEQSARRIWKRRPAWACIASAPSISIRCRRWSAAASTMPSPRGQRAIHHADQGRPTSVRLRHLRTGRLLYLSVLDYPVGMAHRRAKPHGHSAAQAAMAEY
jgi:hypothetical protein